MKEGQILLLEDGRWVRFVCAAHGNRSFVKTADGEHELIYNDFIITE